MTNSADPDQLATDLDLQFAQAGHVVFSKRRVNIYITMQAISRMLRE